MNMPELGSAGKGFRECKGLKDGRCHTWRLRALVSVFIVERGGMLGGDSHYE